MKEKISNEQLPYERFKAKGAQALTDAELLAIILRTGTKEMSAVEVAKQVLSMCKYPRENLLGLYDLSLEELEGAKGIGPVKAIKLKALTELAMRIHRTSARLGFNASSPKTVAEYFMEDMRHLKYEIVMLACIDSKGQLLSSVRISEGAVNRSLVSPRNVFIEALNREAVSIILLHNHPSGDPEPSDSDKNITNRIEELGKMLEIRLLDHIIIGDNKYYSFIENGLLISD